MSVESTNTIKEIFQWIQYIIAAVIIALLIRAFIFEPVLVDGHSMDNTLNNGQRLIEYKLGYFFSPPKRGDVIVLQYQKGILKYLPLPDPKEIDYIKRVIGVPGDEVDFKDGKVYINGKELNEPYAKGRTLPLGMKVPAVVPPNNVFVLGDNRENSSDSRRIGFIDYSRIRGKATIRIWPLKNIGLIK